MSLNFIHFDSTNRDNINNDPFNCSFTLSNSIRNIKKIYLKSCEIPLGFYNFRQPQTFSFLLATKQVYKPVRMASVINFTSFQNNNFGNNIAGNFTFNPPLSNSNNYSPVQINITVPVGNWTIDTLLSYINQALIQMYNAYSKNYSFGDTIPVLSQVLVEANSTFPVGYLQLTFSLGYFVTILPSSLNSILGFTDNQINDAPPTYESITASTLTGPNFFNMNPDICLYIYFPTIPHTNTHFSNQLVSFKIPISSGYQAIEFNQENISFAQYIEVSDRTFILTRIQLQIFDRSGQFIFNNGLNWTFTLGIETE